jgi:hypothetical protein
MALTYSQYLEYIKGNIRRPIYKIELLNSVDETPYQTIEDVVINDSGTLNISLNEGVRRTCNLNLINKNGRFNQYFKNLSIGSKFKLYLGDLIFGYPIYFPQGVFIFDDPTLVSETSDKQVQISGTDKWSMLNGQNAGVLDGTYTIPAGTKVGKLIADTLNLNIVNDPIPPIIDSTLKDTVTTYDITKEAGESVSDIFLEVALNISAYIYYDELGRLILKPVEYDDNKGSIYDFQKEDFNYLGGTKTYNHSAIYNSCLVVADNVNNINLLPIKAEAINNDLTDPNSVPNVGFKKTKMITEYTKGITTQQLAQDRVNWELKKVKGEQSSVTINCLPLYNLDVNQIITLTDNDLNANKERFLINNISMPIGTSGSASLDIIKSIVIE